MVIQMSKRSATLGFISQGRVVQLGELFFELRNTCYNVQPNVIDDEVPWKESPPSEPLVAKSNMRGQRT